MKLITNLSIIASVYFTVIQSKKLRGKPFKRGHLKALPEELSQALSTCILSTCADHYLPDYEEFPTCMDSCLDVYPKNIFKQKICFDVCGFSGKIDGEQEISREKKHKFKNCRNRCISTVLDKSNKTIEDKITALDEVKAVDPNATKKLDRKFGKRRGIAVAKRPFRKYGRRHGKRQGKRIFGRKRFHILNNRRKEMSKSDKQEALQCVKNECYEFLPEKCQSCRNNALSIHGDNKRPRLFKKCKSDCFPKSLDKQMKHKFFQCKATCFNVDFKMVNFEAKSTCIKETCWPELSEECQTCKKSCWDSIVGEEDEDQETKVFDFDIHQQLKQCQKENGCSWKTCKMAQSKEKFSEFQTCRKECNEWSKNEKEEGFRSVRKAKTDGESDEVEFLSLYDI